MRALVQRAYGRVEASVAVEEVRLPTPAGGDVCVRVRYAGEGHDVDDLTDDDGALAEIDDLESLNTWLA